jgi:hypothetical protein
LTLEKVIVELGEKDFPAGLFFVAISQVKTLQGLDLFYNTLGSIHQPLEVHRKTSFSNPSASSDFALPTSLQQLNSKTEAHVGKR